MNNIGKMIILLGMILIIIGTLLTVGSKFGFGKLPGDIYYKRGNFVFYAPIMTTIILSLVFTFIANLFLKK